MVECVVKETNLSKDVWFIDITGMVYSRKLDSRKMVQTSHTVATYYKPTKVSMTLVMMMTVIYTTVWVSFTFVEFFSLQSVQKLYSVPDFTNDKR